MIGGMVNRRRLGARRARAQSESAGGDIGVARAEGGLTRAQVGKRGGVSRDTVRRVEEGDPAVQIDTLCAVAEAVGLDIVVRTFRGRPVSLRDSGQLEVAQYLCAVAHPSLHPALEVPAGEHGEACDIGFFGPREIIDTEIDRLILDFQAQYRRNTQKRAWLAARHQRPVRLVMAIEDTPRNRAAIEPHLDLIRRVLPAGSREILKSIRSGEPVGRDGLLWVRRRQPPRPRLPPTDRHGLSRALVP